jgi:hypothetical protein
VKLPPGLDLTVKLAEEILNCGFVTSGDTLRVTQPKILPEQPVPIQSIGYSKGQARALTLVAILSILIQDMLVWIHTLMQHVLQNWGWGGGPRGDMFGRVRGPRGDPQITCSDFNHTFFSYC